MELRLKLVAWEAEGVMRFVFEDPAGAPLPAWTPGAHIDLELHSGLGRSYSLCGDPEDRYSYAIAVRLESEGRGGSRELHSAPPIGQLLRVAGLRNHFQLQDVPRHAFIAGGIGITPILAMARESSRNTVPWTLLYTGRDRSTMAFLGELESLEGGHLDIVDTSSGARADLKAFIDAVPVDAAIYCCGPSSLIEEVVRICEASTPPRNVEFERFAADLTAETHREDDTTFEVELAASGKTIAVGPDETILGAMIAAGVDAEFFCEEGYCGTCETRVLDGTPDHRDSVLGKKERESGTTILPCVSRCLSLKLVLDR